MSSAAKAKPVVLAVGLAEPPGRDGDDDTGESAAGATVAEGEALTAGVTTVDPQAASSSEVAIMNDEIARVGGGLDKRATPEGDRNRNGEAHHQATEAALPRIKRPKPTVAMVRRDGFTVPIRTFSWTTMTIDGWTSPNERGHCSF
jgi:hypothetical protein